MTRGFFVLLCLSVPAGGWAEEPAKAKSPLVGLPSKPGPHIEKIKALGDNEWLNLGAPAVDPKWGKARGRSWSSNMPSASNVRGAFVFAEGVHAFKEKRRPVWPSNQGNQ